MQCVLQILKMFLNIYFSAINNFELIHFHLIVYIVYYLCNKYSFLSILKCATFSQR